MRLVVAAISAVTSVTSLGAASAVLQPRLPEAATARAAVARSMPLIQKSADAFLDKKPECFSCHHQSLPAAAVAYARRAGIAVDEASDRRQQERVYGFLAAHRQLLRYAATKQNADKILDLITVDGALAAAYGLYGLDQAGVKPDEVTALTAAYVARKQLETGAWMAWRTRPPLEASPFTLTALAVYDLNRFAPASVSNELTVRKAQALAWFRRTPAECAEDLTFRLAGLRWCGGSDDETRAAAKDLIAWQRPDGGWPQLSGGDSDAYATGQALVMLHDCVALPVSDRTYRKGVAFLLRSQRPDGSWRVVKRAKPLQVYFDCGYPHGSDQFISICGACWATMALALTSKP